MRSVINAVPTPGQTILNLTNAAHLLSRDTDSIVNIMLNNGKQVKVYPKSLLTDIIEKLSLANYIPEDV